MRLRQEVFFVFCIKRPFRSDRSHLHGTDISHPPFFGPCAVALAIAMKRNSTDDGFPLILGPCVVALTIAMELHSTDDGFPLFLTPV